MGIGVINAGHTVHTQPAWNINEYQLYHHQQSLNVDTKSNFFDAYHFSNIKVAAVQGTQAQFDAACEAATGGVNGWYDSAPNTSVVYRSTLKAAIARSI